MAVRNLKINHGGSIEFFDDAFGCAASASLSLHIIRNAWLSDVDFEDIADGFGKGEGTGPDNDWSGIRDSSPHAHSQMLERALSSITFVPKMKGA